MNIIFKRTVKVFSFCMVACLFACSEEDLKSSENQITEFSVTINDAEMVLSDKETSSKSVQLSAKINQSGKSITANVPFGADLNLVPNIKISDKAIITPASGTKQDFSKAVNYTVKAENESSNTYTVNLKPAGKPTITQVTNSLKLGEVATFEGQNLKIDGFKTQIKFVYLYAPDRGVVAILDAEPNAEGTSATLKLPESLPKQTYLVSIIVGGVETERDEILNVSSN